MADRIRKEMLEKGWAVTDTREGSFVFYVGDLDQMPRKVNGGDGRD